MHGGNNSTPRVTIGLPVYNGEHFIRDAIRSILDQSFGDFRLVVSDNASTDATVSIVEDLAAGDGRIVLLRSDQNRGAAWNYNRVFAECRSPYFKWAAADDMLAPLCLERLVAVLDASPPSVALVYPRTQWVDAEGRVFGEYEDDLAARPGAPPHVRLRKVVRDVAYGNCIFGLVRTEALRQTLLHGNFPAADYVLLAELALAGEFRLVPEPLFLRRMHEGISSRANPTTETLTRWFDPKRRPVRSRGVTLLRGYLRGIRHARLSRRERLLAYLAFAPPWTRRQVGLRTRLRAFLRRFRTSA
jgi:glycosyltransferase involved in cell wall biosynthesis